MMIKMNMCILSNEIAMQSIKMSYIPDYHGSINSIQQYIVITRTLQYHHALTMNCTVTAQGYENLIVIHVIN